MSCRRKAGQDRSRRGQRAKRKANNETAKQGKVRRQQNQDPVGQERRLPGCSCLTEPGVGLNSLCYNKIAISVSPLNPSLSAESSWLW